jgi:CheY-like chemotaxis protein
VVDDNEFNLQVAQAICQMSGLTCELVRNGEQAIDAVQAGEFNLVLMDIRMPGMDGVDATLAIHRLSSQFERLPIIAVTADCDLEDQARYRAAGMCGMVAKPIRIPALLDEIERALGRRPRESRSFDAPA